MRRLVLVAVIALVALFTWANWPAKALPPNTTADRLVVRKSARQLDVYSRGQLIRSYAISLGKQPIGKKERDSDGRTPEGSYVIDFKKARSSCCYKSLHISYPNAADRAHAAALGVPPGGSIMIHGLADPLFWLGRIHRAHDWTDGCVAVTDSEMEQLWRVVPAGTPIDLRP